eukprot:41183-Eustigmatos_ZCMA.PRE.1
MEVDILIGGEPAKKYTATNGDTWIEAIEGKEYGIRLKNTRTYRVSAHVYIDGTRVKCWTMKKDQELSLND